MRNILTPTVLVSALGYFVDIFDLVLFGILRVPSLRDLGLSDEEILREGVKILNFQMAGFLVGGIVFGVIGDKVGRKFSLFLSIGVYSIANILNAFVFDVFSYALIRFFAGLGLSGELGGAITLVNETMDKEKRGWGATIVAGAGISGGVFAGLLAETFHWRIMYIIGGVMGIVLLFFRMKVLESSLFENVKKISVKRGDLVLLFSSRERVLRYIRIFLIGTPIWYSVAILVILSPEIGSYLGVSGIKANIAVAINYLGISIGDFLSGTLSQVLKSRKKGIIIFLIFLSLTTFVYHFSKGISLFEFYILIFFVGVSAGYWVLFITISAESFGTNLRATVATSTPNFVRASTIFYTSSFLFLKKYLAPLYSSLILGLFGISIAFLCTLLTKETYGKNLDFVEK